MVSRFLGWKLPENFSPDCGISFSREVNGGPRTGAWWPTGTNLFDATQAETMINYLLEGLPNHTPQATVEGDWREEFDSLYEDLDYPVCCTSRDCACNKESVRENIKYFIERTLADHQATTLRCAECGNPFEHHHWMYGQRGKLYHTGCLQKDNTRPLAMVQNAIATTLRELREWGDTKRRTTNIHDDANSEVNFFIDNLQAHIDEKLKTMQ